MTNYHWIILYLALNLVTFVVFWWDKRQAVLHRWRTPEVTLLTLAAVGGSVGALCAMKLCRHKTKHLAFALGIPMMVAAQVILLAYLNL